MIKQRFCCIPAMTFRHERLNLLIIGRHGALALNAYRPNLLLSL
jgi:hypothetical protein